MIVNFKSILADYRIYRKAENAKKKKNMTTNYNNCREKLTEVIKVLGLDIKYFKTNSIPNQDFQFKDEDKEILFEILDKFIEKEFVLIRKGEFLKVPVTVLEFYINAFTTILQHLGVDDKIVEEQRLSMIHATYYELAKENEAALNKLVDIKKDIQKIMDFENNLVYSDYVSYMKYVTEQIHILQDSIRHVYKRIDERRYDEDFRSEVNQIKQMSVEEKKTLKERITVRIKLDQELQNNNKYVELTEKINEVVNEPDFLKNKHKNLIGIFNQLNDLTGETQMKLFGKFITAEDLLQKDLKLESSKMLELAIEDYDEMVFHRIGMDTDDDLDDELLSDTLCKQLFKEYD